MAQTPNVTLVANLQTLSGIPNDGAKLVITLLGYGASIPVIMGTTTLVQISQEVDFVADTLSVPLWANDQISPSGTWYQVQFFDGDGNEAAAVNYRLLGTGEIDLSAIPAYDPDNVPGGQPLLYIVTLNNEGPPIVFKGSWNPGVPYAKGDAVLGSDGNGYASLFADNFGNDPTTGSSEWGIYAAAGASGSSFTETLTFTGQGSQVVVHNLDTTSPQIQFTYISGGINLVATPIDASSVRVFSLVPTVAKITVLGGVVVPSPPSFITQPSNQDQLSGGSVTFVSLAVGAPTPTYQWQRSTTAGGSTFANIVGATMASYLFSASSADDGFLFRCVATNNLGSTNSNSALFTLIDLSVGLVDYYPMREGTGPSFIDSIPGHSDILVFFGTNWVGGFNLFDGTTQFGVASTTNYSPACIVSAAPWSVTGHINPTSITGGGSEQTLTGNSASFTIINGFQIFTQDAGEIKVLLQGSQTAGDAILVKTPALALVAGTYTAYAVTYDGSGHAAGIRVYLNGVLQTLTTVTDSLVTPVVAPSTAPLSLMGTYNGNTTVTAAMGGFMHDQRYYDRALSAVEISFLVSGDN